MAHDRRSPSARAILATVATSVALIGGILGLLSAYVFQTKSEAHEIDKKVIQVGSDATVKSTEIKGRLDTLQTSVEGLKKENERTVRAVRHVYRRQEALDDNMERLFRRFQVRYERREPLEDPFDGAEEEEE